jgi:hypothetical protein
LKKTIIPVAGEPLQGALEPGHQVAEGLVIVVKDAHDLLGLGGLGEGGEGAQVAEHHRDVAPMALQERLVAGGHDQVGQLGREEPAQPAQPLQLLDLLLDPLGEGAVPLGQLGRLPLDGLVVALDAQQRPHPGQQLGLVEGLGHEVVGAGLDGQDPLLVAAGGDHDHGQERGGRVLAQPAADLVAVHLRHDDVEQDQVRAALGGQGQRLRARPGAEHPVAAGAEHGVEQADVGRQVVDGEDEGLIGHGAAPRR